MKKIDILLKRIAEALSDKLTSIFSPNDDEFIEALGRDPEQYKETLPDGTVLYDYMRALKDTAASAWKEDE